MIHKTGSGSNFSSVAKYCMQANDHDGKKRESINLISGDLDLMKKFTDTLNKESNVVHSILRFTPYENKRLGEDTKLEILENFIEQQSVGLPSPKRLMTAVIEHDKDKSSAHFHIITARADLETNKTFQPWVIQRGDKDRYHSWNDTMTDKYGLDNPDSLMKITSSMGKEKRRSQENKVIENTINKEVESYYKKGVINNRDDVERLLKKEFNMQITRKNEHSLSFKNSTMKRAIKLDSFAFSEKFKDKKSAEEHCKLRRERPAPSTSIKKLKAHENKVKSYYKKRFNTNTTQNNTTKNNNVNKLLEKFNTAINNNITNNNDPLKLFNKKVNEVNWQDAIDAAKNFNMQKNNNDENELAKVTKFLKTYVEFKKGYEEYRNNIDFDKEPTEKEVEYDRDYKNMDIDVGLAIENIEPQINALENELKSLENTMQQQETQIQNETIKETQKTQQKGGGEKKGKPAANKGFEQAMRGIVAAWKQQDFRHKRNDAQNNAEREKSAFAHRPKEKKKKKDDD